MNSEHFDIFKRGMAAWNQWRQVNPGIKPVLAGVDLSEQDLSGFNFSETDLSGADLCQVKLSGANLKLANLRGTDLSGSDLTNSDLYKCDFGDAFLTQADLSGAYVGAVNFQGADLRGASFEAANMAEADFRNANLMEAQLCNAEMTRCNLTHANLRHSNFKGAGLVDIAYGNSKAMRGNFFGIGGLDSATGNALFVREARDQDYLDAIEHRISGMPAGPAKFVKQVFFRAWGLIDFGRSLVAPISYAAGFVLLFGLIFSLDMRLDWGLFDFEGTSRSWLTPFYFSVVTFTTLGYGDVTPLCLAGEFLVIVEVVLGYTTLGVVLSILANKVARRS